MFKKHVLPFLIALAPMLLLVWVLPFPISMLVFAPIYGVATYIESRLNKKLERMKKEQDLDIELGLD